LPAIVVYQPTFQALTFRHRRQAGSHRFCSVFADLKVNKIAGLRHWTDGRSRGCLSELLRYTARPSAGPTGHHSYNKPRRISRVACCFLTRLLEKLGIPYEVKVVSAHRTPDLLFQYADEAESRGIEVIIAGAGGAAHLPGMCAAKTHLPVLGVPVQSSMLSGVDSLLSIVQMPAGIPVATLAIGKAGAINAALLSASILGAKHPQFHAVLKKFRAEQTDSVLDNPDPRIA